LQTGLPVCIEKLWGGREMIVRGEQAEERGLLQAAELMCVAARTAPKGKGIDNLETIVVTGRELTQLAEEMKRISEETGAKFFARDAGNLEESKIAVVLGTTIKPMALPACGYCGFGDCEGMKKNGGICAYNAGDLGIAIGSAVGVAAAHHVDNRVMFSVGRAAINLGFFSTDVKIAFGIPLEVSGKNPFFDRKPPKSVENK